MDYGARRRMEIQETLTNLLYGGRSRMLQAKKNYLAKLEEELKLEEEILLQKQRVNIVQARIDAIRKGEPPLVIDPPREENRQTQSRGNGSRRTKAPLRRN